VSSVQHVSPQHPCGRSTLLPPPNPLCRVFAVLLRCFMRS
jgi:hypothetical protein